MQLWNSNHIWYTDTQVVRETNFASVQLSIYTILLRRIFVANWHCRPTSQAWPARSAYIISYRRQKSETTHFCTTIRSRVYSPLFLATFTSAKRLPLGTCMPGVDPWVTFVPKRETNTSPRHVVDPCATATFTMDNIIINVYYIIHTFTTRKPGASRSIHGRSNARRRDGRVKAFFEIRTLSWAKAYMLLRMRERL